MSNYSGSIKVKIKNDTSSTFITNKRINFEFAGVDGDTYYGDQLGKDYAYNRVDVEKNPNNSRIDADTDTVTINVSQTVPESGYYTLSMGEYFSAGHPFSYSQNSEIEWDGKRKLYEGTAGHWSTHVAVYDSKGTSVPATITPVEPSDGTYIICDHEYLITIVGDNGGDPDDPQESNSSNSKEYDPYTNVPEVSASGWESYGKGKRAELMYASIIPSCTDACFFTTKYFMFAGATAEEVELDYIYKGEWSKTKSRRYVFYEIDANTYNSHSSDVDYYRLDGVFGGLNITDTDFAMSGQTANGSIDSKQFLGTTSSPKYLEDHINTNKQDLFRILKVAQGVGDSSGRQPTYGLNYGRVRPLGNTEHPTKTKRKNDEPQAGNPWNGFSNNTLKARYAEKCTDSNNYGLGADYNFVSALGSDEVHGDGPTSWPSGHSSQCWAMAMTLVQLLGLKYKGNSSSSVIDEVCRYVHKAYKFGVLRTVGRFHWNSDTIYGKVFGSLIMPILNSSYSSNSSDNVEYFNEIFDAAALQLIGNIPSRIESFDSIDTSHEWYNDFKDIIDEISNKTDQITQPLDQMSDDLKRYLWYMYKMGRNELDSNNKLFDFFNSTCTNFYPSNNDSQYYDSNESNWTGCRAWFPEVFTGSQSLTLIEGGNSVSISYHGSNTSYNVSGVTNTKILCSWLMAFCLSELYISKAAAKSPSNQTKIFYAAYQIGGGRELNVYDEYATTHDPMYLRLAAGIIYCFNRGQISNGTIDSLKSASIVRIKLDTDNVFGIQPSEANKAIGNDAEKALQSEASAWAQATVNYGVDNYYIFPNAPGPYVSGRKFSKPYETDGSKPNSGTYQNVSQFILPEKRIINPHGGDTIAVYENYDLNAPLIEKDLILFGDSLGEYKYSVGVLSDIHANVDNNTSTNESDWWYDEDDLIQALKVFTSEYKQECDKSIQFICACGDVTESYCTNLGWPEADAKDFNDVYTANANGLRFYSPLGNHDFMGMFNARTEDASHRDANRSNEEQGVGYNENVNERLNNIWYQYVQPSTIVGNDIHYFRYKNQVDSNNLSGWNRDSGGVLNNYSKLNYWFEKNGDIYVIMSIDYGNDTWDIPTEMHDHMIRARRIREEYATSSDTYIAAMRSYVGNDYTDGDKLYDYQFYHPNVLIWLKEIIAANTDKKIFVFSHHFLPHKVGNCTRIPSETKEINGKITHPWIYGNIQSNGEGASALSGIQFRFINKLNNEYKNVVFFSGHSHITWANMNDEDTEGVSDINSNKFKNSHIDNHDYNIVTPQAGADPALVYTKHPTNTSPIATSGYWVALPSLAKPVNPRYTGNWDKNTIRPNGDITIMDVYESGVKIKGWAMTRTTKGGGGGGNSIYSNDAEILKEAAKYTLYNDDEFAWKSGPYFEITVVNGTSKNLLVSGEFRIYIDGVKYAPKYRNSMPGSAVTAAAVSLPKMKEWNTDGNGNYWPENHDLYGATAEQCTNFAIPIGGSKVFKCKPDTSTEYSSLNITTSSNLENYIAYSQIFTYKSNGSYDLLTHSSGVFLKNNGDCTARITSADSNHVSITLTITNSDNHYLLSSEISNTAYEVHVSEKNGVESRAFVVYNLYYHK